MQELNLTFDNDIILGNRDIESVFIVPRHTAVTAVVYSLSTRRNPILCDKSAQWETLHIICVSSSMRLLPKSSFALSPPAELAGNTFFWTIREFQLTLDDDQSTAFLETVLRLMGRGT